MCSGHFGYGKRNNRACIYSAHVEIVCLILHINLLCLLQIVKTKTDPRKWPSKYASQK